MFKFLRKLRSRARSLRVESLETRDLMTLITTPPTINALSGRGVTHNQFGGISIVQPAKIQVYGTATPASAGTAVTVGIYAEDSNGTIVNGGKPLATIKPDFLGQYHATVTLPSVLRADINYLIARETASSTQTSKLTLQPSTLTGLSGTLNLGTGSTTPITGTLSTPATPITGITGTITTPDTTITGLGGTFTIPPTPITDITATVATPSFPITTPLGPGTGGPITGGTLTNGTGTLGTQTGTLTGASGTVTGTTSPLTGGSGTIAASTSTLTGTATLGGGAGTLSNGTGTISGTTGTLTTPLTEVAVSQPLVVLIHQPKIAGHTTRSTASLTSIRAIATAHEEAVASSIAAYMAHHAK